MANKSIIDIDVNDEQFAEFYRLFQEYQKHLEDMPDSWKAINAASMKAGKSFQGSEALLAESASHLHSIASHLHKATAAQKSFNTASRQGEGNLKKMGHYAAGLSKSIFGIGKYLFKVGALGGGIGLLGGFGLRELGEATVSRQRTARGIGLNQGQLRAWQVDMSRYAGTSILSGVANAQTSPAGLVNLSMASGLSIPQVQSMRPDALAYRIMQREATLWKQTPKSLRTVNPFIHAAMQTGISQEDIRRWAATPPGEMAAAHAQYMRNAGQFNIGAGSTQAMYGFVRELSAAGAMIQKVLTVKLAQLAPALTRFLQSLTGDVNTFLKTELTPKNLNKMAAGIHNFAELIGSPQFTKDVQNFGKAIVDVTHAILTVAGWFMPTKKAAYVPGWMGSNTKIPSYLTTPLFGGGPAPVVAPSGSTHGDMHKLMKVLAKRPPAPVVTIHNKAGANVAVQANSAGY